MEWGKNLTARPTVGTWVRGMKELTFAPVSARIFRYRFTFIESRPGRGVRDAKFTHWAERVEIPDNDRS